MSAINGEKYYGRISKMADLFNKLPDTDLGMNYIRGTKENSKEEEQER